MLALYQQIKSLIYTAEAPQRVRLYKWNLYLLVITGSRVQLELLLLLSWLEARQLGISLRERLLIINYESHSA